MICWGDYTRYNERVSPDGHPGVERRYTGLDSVLLWLFRVWRRYTKEITVTWS